MGPAGLANRIRTGSFAACPHFGVAAAPGVAGFPRPLQPALRFLLRAKRLLPLGFLELQLPLALD